MGAAEAGVEAMVLGCRGVTGTPVGVRGSRSHEEKERYLFTVLFLRGKAGFA